MRLNAIKHLKSKPLTKRPWLNNTVNKGWTKSKEDWSKYGLEAFDSDNLSRIYPNVRVLRGGIIPICNNKICLVKEKVRIIIDDDDSTEENIVPGLFGFPKGAIDHQKDKSILATAIREFYEEVGLQISPDDICFPAIIFERPEVNEVLILFPVIYDQLPQVNINTNELAGCMWVSLSETAYIEKMMSNPTRTVIKCLGYSDQFSA